MGVPKYRLVCIRKLKISFTCEGKGGSLCDDRVIHGRPPQRCPVGVLSHPNTEKVLVGTKGFEAKCEGSILREPEGRR